MMTRCIPAASTWRLAAIGLLLAVLSPLALAQLPPIFNQSNVTAPSSPSLNRTNATAPSLPSSNLTNATTPSLPSNLTNATTPSLPSSNLTNATTPSLPSNRTNATAPVPISPRNQTNATLPLPPRLNQSNATTGTPLTPPLNRSNVTTPPSVTQPIPQNQTLRPGGQPVAGRNDSVANRSSLPGRITGASTDSGILTPLIAQQRTTAPGQEPQQPSSALNANEVVALAGWNGSVVDGGETLILRLPRSQLIDLRVKGIFVPGAGSMASFRPLSDGGVDVMVELLLLDDEVDPVLRAGLSAGMHAMALHTHFLFDQPKAYFLHLHGAGISARTAAAVLRNLTDTITGVRASPPPAAAAPVTTRPSTVALSPIQSALAPSGLRAAQNPEDGTVQVLAPPLTASVMGYNASHSLGCQSEATFAGTDADAIVYGQFCSTQSNLQRVLVGTLQQELSVTAIVNHFIGDVPQTIFVHFWGRGPAQTLASAVAQAFPESYRSP